MTAEALDAAGRLLARRVGLRLDHAIRARLVSAVRDEADRMGRDLPAYVDLLDRDPDALQELLNLVTVQETSFFRDPGQFAALAAQVLPAVVAEHGVVRIWSAGCANGQEAYSLAMTLAESGARQWEVIATDVSTSALGRTRRGRYTEREITGLNATRRARYLESAPADAYGRPQWDVVPSLREQVKVLRHNLVADPPPLGPGACQIVFCRNVLIYIDRDNVRALLDRLRDWLPPDGFLFLGYSESLWQVSDAFDLVRIGDAFAYSPAPPVPAPDSQAEPSPPEASATEPTRPSRAAPRPAKRTARPRRERPAPTPARPPAAGAARDIARATGGELPDTVEDLFARGEEAIGRGDAAAAVAAFRRVVYLEPDDPIGYLNLALALEASGDADAARRAYAACRASFERAGDRAAVEARLEGYHLDDLLRLLDERGAAR